MAENDLRDSVRTSLFNSIRRRLRNEDPVLRLHRELSNTLEEYDGILENSNDVKLKNAFRVYLESMCTMLDELEALYPEKFPTDVEEEKNPDSDPKTDPFYDGKQNW